ncbi:hypothetical protein CNMCM5793_004259 [Aspergillus hiratsukae]|uniref:N-acetyltransferase domain-containing protein n=1 Tax=Aspergillus hiratsukae TaxID=1194566 RepID=A0A8H6QDR3_9EURO|nr:hypothetical protein CNMCM5793_004259 [Aspergillus hiratsukae]KAF7171795.1 hypothetical protein CNMCM6106_006160 [Aspergillus hiratsukae]
MQSGHDEATALLLDAQTNRFVAGMPFTCIREVTAAGESDVYIGNVSLRRYAFYEFKKGSSEREEAETRNAALGVGDARIVWGFGDYLAPTHHGKGIMTAVIKAVIEEWAVPRMNARVIKASAYADNRASMRVFEKNGFRLEHELEDWAVVPRDRGGGVKSIVVLVWEGTADKSEVTDS